MENENKVLENDEIINDEEMLDETATTIILTAEDGTEAEFEFLDLIPYQDNEYIILLPFEEQEEDNETEVTILQYQKGEDGVENYIGVIDEEVLDAVFNIFKEKWGDHFNFID